MKDWQELGSALVLQAAREDMEYQRLHAALAQAENTYLAVVSRLSVQDQKVIEHYISLCDEISYYETQLAWQCGKLQK